MARSFSDIGAAIFDSFFERDDNSRLLDFATTSGTTGFSVSRTSKDDGSMDTSLSATAEFEANSWVSAVSITTSNTEDPSLNIESNKLKSKNVSISSSVQDPNLSFSIGYNDEDKYCIDLSVNTDFTTQQLIDVDIAVSYDSLLNKNLLIGANYNIKNDEKQELEQSYNFGAEYKYKESTSLAIKANNNLNELELGFMYARNEYNTLFGKVFVERDEKNVASIDYSLGVSNRINDISSIDLNVNKNNTINMRYNMEIMKDVNGFVAANFDLNDVKTRAKLQYGISIA